MDTAEATDVIDEATIKKVMEDVGLRSVDLNSEASEPCDDMVSIHSNSSALSPGEHTPEANGTDDSQNEDEQGCITEETEGESDEDEEDEMPDLSDAPGLVNQTCNTDDGDEEDAQETRKTVPNLSLMKEAGKTADNLSSDVGSGHLDDELLDQNDKGDQNQNSKLQGTPAALRRSSRTKLPTSPAPNETPSSVAGRTTRSQLNPEIIAKQKSFMHKYQIAVKSSMDSYVRSASSDPDPKVEQQATKRKWEDTGGPDSIPSPHSSPVQEKKSKRSITSTPSTKVGNNVMESQNKTCTRRDTFCWACHMDGQVLECRLCPRVFHQRCVQLQSPIPPKWSCTECGSVANAEKHNILDVDQLSVMLNFAMERIKSVADAQPFFKPVDTEEFPHYTEYIVCPVDISQLEDKIAKKSYASTRAFLADFRWILHNCIIFNSFHSKLTSTARTLMKVCKHEMAEIDTCADCYVHAHTKRETWFLEPCRRPHLLLWAKLKGFPHWPAKAMKANKEGNVDVRFFGAHDRAWVPAKDCFLYSREMPIQLKNQRKANLVASVEEVDQHIKLLVERYGPISYPAPRTAYNPLKEDEQLQLLIPGFKVTESNSNQLGESGDAESIHSDSDSGEAVDNDPPPPATDPEADRSEGRSFLAMLQLTPRTDTATPRAGTPTLTSASPVPSQTSVPAVEPKTVPVTHSVTAKLQAKNSKVVRGSVPKANCTETTGETTNRNSSAQPNDSEVTCEVVKTTKSHSPPRRSSTAKETLPIKTEPSDHEEEDDSCTMVGSRACSISLAIDNVVGNYKPLVSIKPKVETPTKAATPKQVAKPAAGKPPGTKSSTTVKTTPKSVSKSVTNRPSSVKIVPKSNAKTLPMNRHLVDGDEEEDLDPAMYLDPTITITLINNDEKKVGNKNSNDIASASSISSSDLQALNALGENVSITVVPKRKSGIAGGARSKENEAIEQPMVIEVDPAALQKTRTPTQSAKARKSFPSKLRPVGGQTGQQSIQKSTQKNAAPPMVSIPSRHLGVDINRPSTMPHQSTSSRIPSITVRPVTQMPTAQPSIILQSGSSDVAPLTTITAAMKQPNSASSTTTSSNSTSNNTLTLNTMHTLGPDSAFGTGGLLLTFNRSIPSFAPTAGASSTSSAAQNKVDCGPLSTHLASKTQQIADMVRNTLETLMHEMSSAGNLEATIAQLQLELERCRSVHQQEIAEMKKTLEAQQTSAETDKQRAVAELRRQMEADKQKAIDEIKKKQWCAYCSQEAIFYCCWNTAYCDYPCQQAHWPKHTATCANANQNTEVESVEAEMCDSPIEHSSPKTPTPQKSIPTVNGSPSQSRKASSSAKTNNPTSSTNDLGYTVLTSSDMSVSLTTSPNNAVAVRVAQPITQSITPTVATPLALLVSTPVHSSTDLSQSITSPIALPQTTVQCVKRRETNEPKE